MVFDPVYDCHGSGPLDPWTPTSSLEALLPELRLRPLQSVDEEQTGVQPRVPQVLPEVDHEEVKLVVSWVRLVPHPST